MMIKSYSITALRNFKKNKVSVMINVIGLSLGIAATLLAVIFIIDELSFDTFHTKADRLYRLNKVIRDTSLPGDSALTAESAGLMGPTMVDEFPEVEKVVRYNPWYDEVVLSVNDKNFLIPEGDVAFADSTFFQVFDFQLLKGDPKRVLSRPSTIVLTEEVAAALFGDADPIGKSVIGLRQHEFEVTGIVKSPPRNSHLQFSGLISWTTTTPGIGPWGNDYDFMNNWIAQAICTYVLLTPGADAQALQSKFPDFMQRHMPTRVDKYALYLQPFSQLYLHSYDLQSVRMAKTGNIQYIRIFTIIAAIMLLIACVNYINITTSRSTRRAREVGMRKSLGATRQQLVQQFLGESLLITIFAVILSLLLVDIGIPFFNDLAGKSLSRTMIFDVRVLLSMALLSIVVGSVSGLYPALVIASFRPSQVLKSNATHHPVAICRDKSSSLFSLLSP